MSPLADPKRVFIIFGRDEDAHRELVRFLQAIGLQELSFETVASALGPNPFIADIVVKGIEMADAVIALFTPDEQAVLYDPRTGRCLGDRHDDSRWQARPNVIFEAGVAFGTKKSEVVLAVLGADVRLFSDIGGVHFVRLDAPGGKQNLYDRLSTILGELRPTTADWATSSESGDFRICLRERWPSFDEVDQLGKLLRNRRLGAEKESLLQIVHSVVESDPNQRWELGLVSDFMGSLDGLRSEHADDAYWWLTVYGFFRFRDIHQFFSGSGDDWQDSAEFAEWTERGKALIERLRVGSTSWAMPAPRPQSADQASRSPAARTATARSKPLPAGKSGERRSSRRD